MTTTPNRQESAAERAREPDRPPTDDSEELTPLVAAMLARRITFSDDDPAPLAVELLDDYGM